MSVSIFYKCAWLYTVEVIKTVVTKWLRLLSKVISESLANLYCVISSTALIIRLCALDI